MYRPASTDLGLRQQAEAIVRERAARSASSVESMLPEALRLLLHESRVHQAELELQNDELSRAQIQLDSVRARYFDLYDHAPVGYCTISTQGVILQANLKAGDLLGVGQASLVGRLFSSFILKEGQDRYDAFLKALPESADSLWCELRMVKNDGSLFWAHLFATVAPIANASDTPEIRLILTDITEYQQALTTLLESEERYRTTFRVSPNAVTITRLADGCYLDVNDGFVRTYGWSRDEVIGKTAEEIGIWKNLAHRQSLVDILLRDGYCECFEAELLTHDGKDVAVLVSAHLIMIESDPCLLSITHNITERKRALDALREQKEFFHLITESLSDFIAVLDLDGRRIYNSPSYKQYFGVNSDLRGTDSFDQLHPDDRERVKNVFEDTVKTGQGHQLEYRLVTPDGGVRTMESRGRVMRNRAGSVTRVVVVSHDITERKLMEDQVRQMAFHDTLTRLPNRRLFSDRLTQTMAATSRSGHYGAVMFLDLDDFKSLNDRCGHDVGDLLLIEAAERLKGCVRDMDTVARFGGDEFVVMISELATDKVESIAEAGIIAEKIRLRLAEPYRLSVKRMGEPEETVEHLCTASIGVVVFIGHGTSQENILKWADAAMYLGKEGGRNSFRFVEPEPDHALRSEAGSQAC